MDTALVATSRFRNPSPHPSWPDPGHPDWRATEVHRLRVLEPAGPWRRAMHAVRTRIRRGLVLGLAPEAAGVARALVLGDGRAVERDLASAVRSAGLSHVLAVSGMHVTLVVGTLALVLRRTLLLSGSLARRVDAARLAALLAAPLAVAYAELAGGAPSAWRASLTATAAFLLRAAGRRPDALVLALACAVPFAALDPEVAVSPAFLLSIAATVAVLDPAPAGTSAIRAAARTSVRASIATAPIVVWCFGGAPVAGVLANLVVVPFACAVLLPLALVVAVALTLGAPGSSHLAALFEVGSRAFASAAGAFGRIDAGRDLPPLDVAGGLLLAAACFALLVLRRPREQATTLAALALALGGTELWLREREQPRGELRATFVDVGQGDAAVLDLPDGRVALVDAGGAPNGGADPGARALVPLLRARRRDHIDLLVITHPHPDHYGGLGAIADAFPIAELWDTGQAAGEAPDGELSALLARLAARGTRVRRPPSLCGAPRDLGGVRFDVLWPCPRWDPGWDPNDNSLVLRVRYGARTLLLAGDAEAHTEAALAGRLGRADVLKVGHHGSRTSSSAAFLDEVAPWLAIVSAGPANRFGHPHPEVWERLERGAAHRLRTDLDGGVVVRTDGRSISFAAWSGAAASAEARVTR